MSKLKGQLLIGQSYTLVSLELGRAVHGGRPHVILRDEKSRQLFKLIPTLSEEIKDSGEWVDCEGLDCEVLETS